MGSESREQAWHWYRSRRYGILLAALLLVYLLYPFASASVLLQFARTTALALMMGSALLAIWRRKSLFFLAAALGLIATASQLADDAGLVTTFDPLNLLVRVAFTMIIITVLLRGIAREHAVTMNAVYGVCAVYLLMGLAWSQVYESLELAEPGSFRRSSVDAAIEQRYDLNDNDLLYFSLITMTTVGYGDITPSSPAARTLSSLQGLIGQLFVAIFLARMVSLEVGNRMAARRGPPDG